MADKDTSEIVLNGIGASQGICIGKAYLVDKEGVDVVEKYFIDKKKLKKEIKRFKSAVKSAKDEVQAIIEDTHEEQAYILETHMVLLKDKMLYDKTIEIIEKEQVNAEWALKKVVSNLKSMFQNITDPYLRERASDITHVSDKIMRNLVGADAVNISEIRKRVILVAHDLSPAETSQIQLEKIMGLVTDRGGNASHTGIIARTLELPAVLGLKNATRIIKNDDLIVVDGTTGTVIINPSEQTLVQSVERIIKYKEYRAAVARGSHLAAETTDGFRLHVMGNIELPEEVVSVIDHGGDGIGLYRTEFQYLSRPDFPKEDELFDKYRDVVEVMAPKPVTIRTLDINGDKAIAPASESAETNPALGLRAIRYCLQNPDVFKTQLRAILRAAAFGNVRLLIPMISSCDEIFETKRILNEAADSLDKEGIVFNRDIEIGIMIEVPSAVIMADIMAQNVDFFSIGTNDLIQYSLAIDRGNNEVAHLFNPLHPAIIRSIKHVVDVAKDKGIKVFMCGEMANDPINMPILLGIGIDGLSMNPQSIPAVKNIIRNITIKNARLFIKDVLKKSSSAEIVQMVQDTYGDILPAKLY
ncbi:MAG: phosphoenolpyruvate--protein phosphotransferase [Bacteroidales bacterium]|jgi:phosphotransferase system enzyme I (PtsI)|nr:phosphoenolpyruvate--protein phosphotransferase [Bacteroidales bacterium]